MTKVVQYRRQSYTPIIGYTWCSNNVGSPLLLQQVRQILFARVQREALLSRTPPVSALPSPRLLWSLFYGAPMIHDETNPTSMSPK